MELIYHITFLGVEIIGLCVTLHILSNRLDRLCDRIRDLEKLENMANQVFNDNRNNGTDEREKKLEFFIHPLIGFISGSLLTHIILMFF